MGKDMHVWEQVHMGNLRTFNFAMKKKNKIP